MEFSNIDAKSRLFVYDLENRIPQAWQDALPAERAEIELPASLTGGFDAYDQYCTDVLHAEEQTALAQERESLTHEVPSDLVEPGFARELGAKVLPALARS